MIAARHTVWLGAALCAALALPTLRELLEASMTRQMLAQMPLLALGGWYLARCAPQRMRDVLAAWDRNGVSGLLLVSLASLVWMLPRALDAALDVPAVTVAKFLSVPLLIGAPLALSWPRAGFVVRGVFLLEVIATAFRLGWLYIASPERLCANYLLDDQQQLGRILMAIGVAIIVLLAWKLIWGQPQVHRASARRD